MGRKVAYSFVALDKFSRVADKIRRKVQAVRRGFRSMAKDIRKTGERLKGLGSKMRGFSMVAAGMAAGSLKAFADVEKGITNVYTLLDQPDIDAHGERLAGMAKDAMLLGFSIEDANKALFDNVSALGLNKQSLDAYEAAQILAIAGVADLSVTVDGITSVMNAYGKETTNATDVANAFFSSQKAGKTTVARLSSVVGAVAPIAKTAGIGYKTLLAAMSQLTLGGLATEESAVALRGVLQSLIKPGTEAEIILADLGVPFGTTGIRAAGLSETLLKLAKVAEESPNKLARAIPNLRGFTAAAALGTKEIANMGKIIATTNKDIEIGTGMMAAYDMQMGTLSQETAMAWGSLKVLGSEIGEVLAPAMRFITRTIISLVEKFRGLNKSTQKFLVWTGVIIAAIGPIIAIVGVLMMVLSWPIVLIAAIVAAVIAGVAIIIQQFDWIKEKWDFVKNSVKGWLGMEIDDPELKSKLDVESSSKTEIGVTVKGAKNTIESVETKSTGPVTPKVGLNMEGVR